MRNSLEDKSLSAKVTGYVAGGIRISFNICDESERNGLTLLMSNGSGKIAVANRCSWSISAVMDHFDGRT